MIGLLSHKRRMYVAGGVDFRVSLRLSNVRFHPYET